MGEHDQDILKQRAQALKLHGVLAHWSEVVEAPWLAALLQWEEEARAQRSLERRLKQAQLGRFTPLADFDWSWPKRCDRAAIEELMGLGFVAEAMNVVLIGPNGVGKTTIARNLAQQAVLAGRTVLCITAAAMLNALLEADGERALRARLNAYSRVQVLLIDEIGYLSYSNRHADLLFEVVSRRYEKLPTLVTTNRPFAEWGEVFPNAACVVSLIDRLVHHAEIIQIDGASYRLKEAKECSAKRRKRRSARATPAASSPQQSGGEDVSTPDDSL